MGLIATRYYPECRPGLSANTLSNRALNLVAKPRCFFNAHPCWRTHVQLNLPCVHVREEIPAQAMEQEET